MVANTSGCVYTYPAGSTILRVNASDNCGIVLFEWDISGASPVAGGSATVPFTGTNQNGTWGIPNLTVFQVGVTNVQYRITDAQGNMTTCTFTVTVQNNVTATITGSATVQQNAVVTPVITFTGSGSGAAAGTQQYRFTYTVNAGPNQFVNTAVGSNSVTVPQSNAVLGSFTYTLVAVQDLTTGCNGVPPAFTAGSTATIIVQAGVINLTVSVDVSSSQVTTPNFIEYIVVIRNIGALPTNGSAINVNVTPFNGGVGGLTQTQVAGAVTVNGTPYTPTAGWTYNQATGDLTTNNVIPGGGSNTIRLRITRNGGAPGQINSTVTIAQLSGGEQLPEGGNNSLNTQMFKTGN